MAFRAADRVKETTTTVGTGTYSLAGAVTGFRTFVAGIGTTNRCVYAVTDGTSWEINEGVVTDAAPDTLSRDKFLASSSGAAISWGAGSKDVLCVDAAIARNPITKRLSADHAISATVATKVTGLDLVDLRPGTYVAQYILLCQSATATVGIGLGINFTGTAADPSITLRHCSTGAAAATGIMDDTANVLTGSLVEGRASNAYTTTAPNMLNTGVATVNVNNQVIIEVLITVTVAGNLELWHSSETATSTTVKAGSVVILTRIDD